jgi:hypothetical protein
MVKEKESKQMNISRWGRAAIFSAVFDQVSSSELVNILKKIDLKI